MTVLDKLASALGSKGNEPNILLAQQIAASDDHKAIKELVENLDNKDQKIQGDCIKTLYEIGYIKPELIAEYYPEFIELLSHKNNRMVWSGMIALTTITEPKAKEIFSSLELIMDTVNKGSVITKDCGVEILAKLNCYDEYFDKTDPLLLNQLSECPIKQLPMYAEKSLICIGERNREAYHNVIINRKVECEKVSQLKRLEKVLKKMEVMVPG